MSVISQTRAPDLVPERSHWVPLLVLAIIARLILAIVYFHASSIPALNRWGYENIAIALSIHSGHGYGSPFFVPSGPTAIIPPGYPLLIALVIELFGTGSGAAAFLIAFQLILSVATVAVVMLVARSHFDVRTANFAGFLCAICVPIFFRSLWIWDTTLSELLLICGIALAPCVTWNRAQSAAVGFGNALAALINPAILPALVAVFAWSAWRRKRMPWLAVIVFLMTLSPWPIRNAVVFHTFIPLRSNFGYEFWAGNHPGTNGEFSRFDTPIFNAAERQQYLSDGELAYMHEKEMAAESFIRANPLQFLRFCALRVARFWMGTSSASPSPATPMLSILGLVGLVLIRKKKDSFVLFALPIALFPITYYITHADARFLAVISPVLAVLAAHACESLLTLIRVVEVRPKSLNVTETSH